MLVPSPIPISCIVPNVWHEMQKCMKWVKVTCHLLWRLGSAKLLRPADREHRKPSSIQCSRAIYSSICLLRRIYTLKIFFMPLHIEDMKACISVGGGCRQKSGSSFSLICSSKEFSAWTSSGRTIGVLIECKPLLYALIILSGDTNTRSYPETSLSSRKFLPDESQ